MKHRLSTRIISVILTIAMLAGYVYIPEVSAAEEFVHADEENVTFEGQNSLGDLFVEEFSEQANGAETDAGFAPGYDIADVTVNGNVASVEYTALEDARIVVAIFAGWDSILVASGEMVVSADQKTAEITIEGEMPEYFLVEAYMLSLTDFSPLCATFSTPLYTQSMQELLASTVDAYDSELVLNFDEDKTNNFAVYRDDVKRIAFEAGKNIIASMDEENGVYVIENATDDFKNLYCDDVFAYQYGENDHLIAKVADIVISGDTVTITAGELEIEEVFSHVKLDTTADSSDAEMDMSGAAEGITYLGKSAASTCAQDEGEAESSYGKKLEFEYDQKLMGDDNINVHVKAKFEISTEVGLRYLYVDDYLLMNFEFKVGAEGTFSVTGAIGCELLVGTVQLSFYNIISIGIDINFEPKISGSVSAVFSYEVKFGLSFQIEDGNITVDGFYDPGEPKVESKVAVKAFLGFTVSPNLKALGGWMAVGKIEAKIGLELSLKQTVEPESTEDVQHACTACFEGDLSFVFELGYEMKFFNSKQLKLGSTFCEVSLKICDVYLSLDPFAFGFSKCPNIAYRTEVLLVDEEGNPVPNVTVFAGEEKAVTDEKGVAVFVLKPGKYTFMATVGEKISRYTTYVEKATTIKLKAGTEYTGQFKDFDDAIGNIIDSDYMGACGDLTWTLVDGVLTISGEGEMPDYAWVEEAGSPWYASEVITKIVISEGVTKVGDYAFYLCDRVTSAEIADTVETIGEYAFCETNLQSLELPANLSYVGPFAFSDNEELESITIDTTNKKYYAEGNCLITYDGILTLGCKNSVIPDDGRVRIIGYGAFEGCAIASVAIPNSVTAIRGHAFGGCAYLENVTIGAGVGEIAATAFTCKEGTADMNDGWGRGNFRGMGFFVGGTQLSVSSQNPYYYADGNCLVEKSTKTIVAGSEASTIPSDGSILAIGETAFFGSVPDILVIPEGVTQIGQLAFADAMSIKMAVIAESVKEIGWYAFGGTSCGDVVFKGDAPEIEDYIFSGWGCQVSRIYYPDGNDTWTEEMMDWVCAGMWYNWPEWIPYEPGTMPVEIPTASTYTEYANLSAYTLPTLESQTGDVSPLGFIGGTVEEDYWTGTVAEFDDLVPGAEYVLVILAGIETENPLAHENLLHIAQGQADKWGELSFEYTLRQEQDPMYVILCGPNGMSIEDADVSVETKYDGEMHIIDPVVVYDGEQLEEGKDYVLLGDVMYQEAGEYTYYVCGINRFSGILTCTYNLIGWTFEDGLLTVFGGGSLPDYGWDYDRPWAEYIDQITAVVIDEGVTYVGKYTFVGHYYLESIPLPSSLEGIGYSALDCSALQQIVVAEGNKTYATVDGVLFTKDMTTLLQYPCDRGTVYYAIPATVMRIADHAFDSAQIAYVDIPESVTEIESCAFMYADIYSLVIPASVQELQNYAFYDCDYLTSITFLGDAPAMADDCFYNVTATAFHPAGNAAWTEDVKQSYGGTLLWEDSSYITVITKQPSDVQCVEGTTGTLSVRVIGMGLRYQWEYRMNAAEEWSDFYPGNTATASSGFSKYFYDDENGMQLRCRIADLHGNVLYSNVVTVTVTQPSKLENMKNAQYTLADLDIGEDGTYRTPDGAKVYIAVKNTADGGNTQWLSGYTLFDYVDAYGDEYFDLTHWEHLLELMDATGYVELTEESLSYLISLITGNSAWGETEDHVVYYLFYDYPEPVHVHTYASEVTSEPTCTESGSCTYACSSCGDTYTEQLPATGHTAGAVETENCVDATCETDGGYDEVVYCATCGEELSRTHVTLPASGHAWDDGVVTTPATCEKDGVKTYTCQHDPSHTYTEVIPATGHDWGEGEHHAPTCTADGYTVYTCAHCGETRKEVDKGSALGHNLVDGECTHCGAKQFLLGDINMDGEVDIFDANLAAAYFNEIKELTEDQLQAGDVNGDGEVDIFDANLIAAYFNEVMEKFPIE